MPIAVMLLVFEEEDGSYISEVLKEPDGPWFLPQQVLD
jgi:hypothetical protein